MKSENLSEVETNFQTPNNDLDYTMKLSILPEINGKLALKPVRSHIIKPRALFQESVAEVKIRAVEGLKENQFQLPVVISKKTQLERKLQHQHLFNEVADQMIEPKRKLKPRSLFNVDENL